MAALLAAAALARQPVGNLIGTTALLALEDDRHGEDSRNTSRMANVTEAEARSGQLQGSDHIPADLVTQCDVRWSPTTGFAFTPTASRPGFARGAFRA